MRRVLLGVAAFALSLAAQAQDDGGAFDRFMQRSTGTGKSTITFGRDGTPIGAPGVPTASPGTGGVVTNHTGQWRNPSGNSVPISASGKIRNAEIGRLITKRLLWNLVWPIEILLLLGELDFSQAQDGSLQKKSASSCTVAPCYMYSVPQTTNPNGYFPYRSFSEACNDLSKAGNDLWTWTLESLHPVSSPGQGTLVNMGYCYVKGVNKSNPSQITYTSPTVWGNSTIRQPDTNPNEPATMQQLEDAIALKSGWPTSSNVAKATVKAAEDLGEKLRPEVETVTGPAESPGPAPSVKESQNPDGSTRREEKSITHNHTYNGNTINTTTVTVTNITNNGGANITTTTTETSEPEAEKEPQPLPCGLGVPGSPACKIDETGTPKPPDLDGGKTADDNLKPLRDFAQDPRSILPAFPELNWSFQLPSGCAPLAIPAFAPFLQAIDVCRFQPIFHDIMGMVWVIGGLFGAISMFWRSTFAAH